MNHRPTAYKTVALTPELRARIEGFAPAPRRGSGITLSWLSDGSFAARLGSPYTSGHTMAPRRGNYKPLATGSNSRPTNQPSTSGKKESNPQKPNPMCCSYWRRTTFSGDSTMSENEGGYKDPIPRQLFIYARPTKEVGN